jgi:hypothetical protein
MSRECTTRSFTSLCDSQRLKGKSPHPTPSFSSGLSHPISIYSILCRRTVSEEAKDILRGLLERKVASRLGSGPTGATELKRSRFFSVYDFDKVSEKFYEPEFRPPAAANPTDVKNFDKEFTSEVAADSVVEPGHMSETMKEKTKFENFTYQGENKLK